ncbi:hypothetical protein PAE9249_04305 [Paenibacillus sp. CECT 9249]|nr:hypothetical protein PAE9249_04305 [Paenibacillus sp. CECT 9249]
MKLTPFVLISVFLFRYTSNKVISRRLACFRFV